MIQDGSSFGALTPLLAPRSVAIIGASDREGNLGGTATTFLRKFGYTGPIWPVNSGNSTVADLPCYASVADLPGVPDLAIFAVPAKAVAVLLRECATAGVRAAVVWAGGFAEQGPEGRAMQAELESICRETGILLCGPNCIGIINTGIGLTASFSSMLHDHARLSRGVVSMISQSGGISVMAHSRAQYLGLGFRVTVSVGNEASLSVADFIRAVAQDEGTRVIAVYTEGLSSAAEFIDALSTARHHGKPVVILKGGASAASSRAALAHTGKLAGEDRTYEALFREFGVIRVYSTQEMLDVCLQLASLRPGQLPTGNKVLISSFGGGSGVICTDQSGREGLAVLPLDEQAQATVKPLLTPLSSALNPIDFTPGMMTNAKHRANMPAVLGMLGEARGIDAWLFLAAGFDALAPELIEMFDTLRNSVEVPVLLTWQSMPEGTLEALAARGIYTFTEHARAARTLGHLVRHAADLRHRIRKIDLAPGNFPWNDFVPAGTVSAVVSEDVVAGLLEAAGLPVARGRIARNAEQAASLAAEVGYPVAMKGISPAITHRAAAGLVALNIEHADAVLSTDALLRQRALARGVTLDGVWVQHMFAGQYELLVTAFRDREFGVMVGVGMGGGLTEIIDDVVFARAPLNADGAQDLIGRLRTTRRLPDFFSPTQCALAADFIARFSALVASAPWARFTFEINPVKLAVDSLAAVDGLLLIESD